jgi:protein-S-isoprenylcysteine O-methyltransferase Ste14
VSDLLLGGAALTQEEIAMTDARESLWGPLLGTVIFVALVPGTVVGWIPWWLTRWELQPPFLGLEPTRWLGVLLILAGAPFFASFVSRFVVEGRGTPAPIAPTRHLVVGGAFRFVRNPGYVGVVSLVLGQALLFGSGALLVYAALLALGFHLFVLAYEEPTLRATYGEDYERFCREVPRWLPRLRPRAAPKP